MKNYSDTELEQMRIAIRRKRIARSVLESVQDGFLTESELSRWPGHKREDILIALEEGTICRLPDGSLAESFWALNGECLRNCDEPFEVCVSAHAWILPVEPKVEETLLAPSPAVEVEKPERPHLRYCGISKRTGFRSWAGDAALCLAAKDLANSKLLFARARPNSKTGCFLLTVERRAGLVETAPPEPEPDYSMPLDIAEEEEESLREIRLEQQQRATVDRVSQIRAEAIQRQKNAYDICNIRRA